MELARQNRRRLQVPRFAIDLQLPLYACLMLGLLLGGMVIVAGVVALTRLMQPPTNPFAVYDDLIAGNTQDPTFWSNHETIVRAAFDLACITSLTQKYCLYRPEYGPFAVIQFLDDEGESGIFFVVRDSTLTVGDLSLLWGQPTIARRENFLVLHWPDQHMSTVVQSENGQFHYFLPVLHLLLAGYSTRRIGA